MLPTVSDANLVLGRLNPKYFLGGKLPLFPEKALEAIQKHVAEKMGFSLEKAASGILRIVNANMAKGISGNSVERGYDLREFALVTMGGAAALHAADIAKELNMGRVIVPPMSGNFSAVGLVVADIQHDYVRTFARKDYEIEPNDLLSQFKEMEAEGIKQLQEEKVAIDEMEITWSGDLRYEGQSWELNTPIESAGKLDKAGVKRITNLFHELHQQVYSYSEPDEVVELVNLRVRVVGKNPNLTLPKESSGQGDTNSAKKEMRDVYFDTLGWQSIPVYEREALPAGAKMAGPCIIEETISTTLIPPGTFGTIDAYKNMIIEIESGE
jgi:N-methylhydantoinase A